MVKPKAKPTDEQVLAAIDGDELALHILLRDDPIVFCKHVLGFTPHTAQAELLRDDLTSQFTLVVGSRQTGKTYGISAKITHDLFAHPGIRIFIYNPSQAQSDVLFSYVHRFFQTSPYLKRFCKFRIKGSKLLVGDEGSESLLEVVRVGVDGKTARGRSVEGNGYVIGDETQGLIGDGWKTAQACEAIASTNERGGGIVYLSSPGDPDDRNFFFATYKDWSEQQQIAESEGRKPRHKVYTFRSSETDHISPDFLRDQHRRYKAAGREWIYLREHESAWVKAEGLFFHDADVRQCCVDDITEGGRLDSFVWSMDPGGRKSPAVIMVGRFKQSLSRIEVVTARSFIFAEKYKPNDGHEPINEYQELVDVCCDLRRRYPCAWFGVDPNCEKSMTERLKNTFHFPIKDICVGGYNAKMTFLRDLQRALQEQSIVWTDRRITEQLLAFAPPKNPTTGHYEFPDTDFDFIVCLGMLVRYLGDRINTPYAVITAGGVTW